MEFREFILLLQSDQDKSQLLYILGQLGSEAGLASNERRGSGYGQIISFEILRIP
jgi:hypothetical protein